VDDILERETQNKSTKRFLDRKEEKEKEKEKEKEYILIYHLT
jgi:hypothetical protein